ncbi:cobalamin biosynthesis protein CobD [Thermostichus vulcanus NIES-2134]|nr:cobalamin biosynthesis protein CobD [Thermostichus vulcanus NIES-2134]
MSCPLIAYTTLVAASLLDFALGDPWGWPHPVRWMGAYIQCLSKSLNYGQGWPVWAQRIGGAVLSLSLIVGSGLISWGLVAVGMAISPVVGWGIAVIGTASGFAGRSLRDAAAEVLAPLATGNVTGARQALAKYVGRETSHLEPAEILRALLETVSENATDGMMAPLFYGAIATLIVPQGSPLPLVMAYKAASTLDSMIGYREPPYTHWGWFAAKTEDVLTWLPCRLLVFLVALCSGQWQRVWQWCCRDAPKDPSPNSGWSECAYAAALGVRLGGTNIYRGTVKVKPFLGEPLHSFDQKTIQSALDLSRQIYLMALGLTGILLLISCKLFSI